MRPKTIIKHLFFIILASILFHSCEKDELLTDAGARPNFSTDTIMFDTVFVSIGSVTKNFRVYNPYDKTMKISSIRLAGGVGSLYRMNVNGLPGKSFTDVEIRGGDSIWIFVEVTINPNNQLLPYVVQDSIIFETNGNQQDIDLVAWGQNAHFFVAKKESANLPPYVIIDTTLNSTTTWDETLPYVIYGGYGVIDSSTTLIINAGTQIHFSNSGGLWVYKGGTLKVQGTKDKPVVFQGLRRELSLQEEPGQWDRIWINDGGINEIDYAIIKNGFIGLQTETLFDPAMPVSLKLTNTQIRNMSGLGILARNFKIEGWNNVVSNCGIYTAAFTIGGEYEFTHCTFANFWRFGQRSTPAMYLNNFAIDQNGQPVGVDMTKAEFKNCIIYGNNDNELELEFETGVLANHNFRNCIIKADNTTPTTDILHFESIYRNNDPQFKNTFDNNLKLDTLAFAREKGNPLFINFSAIPPMNIDIDAISRPLGGSNPDLGAYERD
ncbi:MAG: hypothetical protein IPN36_12185 [Bacteroidetes bacterium]|nr:hypothetical protein [Bacteroidota bacterium]